MIKPEREKNKERINPKDDTHLSFKPTGLIDSNKKKGFQKISINMAVTAKDHAWQQLVVTLKN